MNKYERALDMLIPDEVDDELVDDYQEAINAIKELINIRRPYKMNKLGDGFGWNCPRCGRIFKEIHVEEYCAGCGQLLIWEPQNENH